MSLLTSNAYFQAARTAESRSSVLGKGDVERSQDRKCVLADLTRALSRSAKLDCLGRSCPLLPFLSSLSASEVFCFLWARSDERLEDRDRTTDDPLPELGSDVGGSRAAAAVSISSVSISSDHVSLLTAQAAPTTTRRSLARPCATLTG